MSNFIQAPGSSKCLNFYPGTPGIFWKSPSACPDVSPDLVLPVRALQVRCTLGTLSDLFPYEKQECIPTPSTEFCAEVWRSGGPLKGQKAPSQPHLQLKY